MSLFSQIAAIHRETRKPKDILWNRFVARPVAAVLLLPLAKTRVTPNQLTFGSLLVFLAAMVLLAIQPGYPWLIAAVCVLELSYVLDCADGQLARLQHRSSPVGAHLDFLMDELKAFLLVAACGIRLWRADGHELWLLEALLGLAAVAIAISLTTFLRRPEYLAATGTARPASAGDYGDGFVAARPPKAMSPIGLVEDLGRFLVHYPSYLLLVAIANQLEMFLHVYIAINAAYAGRSLLSVAWKLGAPVTTPCTKAIIVAAGRGRRLGDRTDEIPKCMVEVAGRPILHWQLRALAAAGVDDVVMVRGYLGHRIDPGAARVRFVDNPEWERNNILASLMYAAGDFAGGFYFSYCDIVYAPAAAAALAAEARHESAAASLIIDRRWADAYQGRDLHPIAEAELAEVETRAGESRVLRVGKQVVPSAQAAGEFIGLAHFSAGGAAALEETWRSAIAGGGLEAPFGRAKSLRQAYLTDALNAMASRGHRLHPVLVDGQWREIDTQQDLAAAGPAMATW